MREITFEAMCIDEIEQIIFKIIEPIGKSSPELSKEEFTNKCKIVIDSYINVRTNKIDRSVSILLNTIAKRCIDSLFSSHQELNRSDSLQKLLNLLKSEMDINLILLNQRGR